MHHLLHGDVAAAADHNLLMVLSLPFISLSGLVVANNIFRKKKLAQQVFYSPVFAWTVLAVVLLFFILRNVPLRPFSFLAP
jgi:predicted membrane protein